MRTLHFPLWKLFVHSCCYHILILTNHSINPNLLNLNTGSALAVQIYFFQYLVILLFIHILAQFIKFIQDLYYLLLAFWFHILVARFVWLRCLFEAWNLKLIVMVLYFRMVVAFILKCSSFPPRGSLVLASIIQKYSFLFLF